MNDACVNHSVQTILNCTIMQRIECVFCIVFTHKEFMKWFRPVIFCHLWSWIIKFYRQILKVLRSPWKIYTFTVWIAFSDSQRIVFPFKFRSYDLNRTYFIDDVFKYLMYKLQERQLFHTCWLYLFPYLFCYN